MLYQPQVQTAILVIVSYCNIRISSCDGAMVIEKPFVIRTVGFFSPEFELEPVV